MSELTPSPTETRTSQHTDRYEALRRHVLDRHHSVVARDGLAVLLGQGVAVWMAAWSKLPAPAVRAQQDEDKRPPLLDGASAEVVRVLAAMALGHIEEVHA